MIEARGREDEQVASRMTLHEEPHHSLVTLHGEIDLAVRLNATELCQAVVDRGVPLVVDAREATFVDSAGMSVLVRLARDAEAGGYPVELRNAPWMLKELLTVTGVDRLLPFADDKPAPELPAPPAEDGAAEAEG